MGLTEQQIIKKMKGLKSQKEALQKERNKLEIRKENLEDEIKVMATEVKKKFKTVLPSKLKMKKKELLEEAEKLLKGME